MPSPLASLFSTIDSTKRRASAITQGLLDSPLDVLKNQLADVRNASVERDEQTASLYKTPEGLLSFDPKQWSPQAKAAHDALAGDALGAIAAATVYHGSPHQFNKFDASKIGTGEGAQVYGHGIYLAENPAVAQQYARQLGTTRPTVDGVPIMNTDPRYGALQAVSARGYDKALADAEQWAKAGLVKPAEVEAIRALKGAKIGEAKTGQVYTVDLPDPKIAQMLDWDARLSEQPEGVRRFFEPRMADRKAIEAQSSGSEWGALAAPRDYDPTGNELMQALRLQNVKGMTPADVLGGGSNAAEVAQLLRGAGIPGVKYRDQVSRSIATEPRKLSGGNQWSVVMPGGQVKLFPSEEAAWAAYPKPTSNFVVFPGEEDALRILSRDSNFGLGPR